MEMEMAATWCFEKSIACGEFNSSEAELSANQKEGRLNVYLIGCNKPENYNSWLETNTLNHYKLPLKTEILFSSRQQISYFRNCKSVVANRGKKNTRTENCSNFNGLT